MWTERLHTNCRTLALFERVDGERRIAFKSSWGMQTCCLWSERMDEAVRAWATIATTISQVKSTKYEWFNLHLIISYIMTCLLAFVLDLVIIATVADVSNWKNEIMINIYITQQNIKSNKKGKLNGTKFNCQSRTICVKLLFHQFHWISLLQQKTVHMILHKSASCTRRAWLYEYGRRQVLF